MNAPHYNYIIKLKKDAVIPKKLEKYVFKGQNLIYVSTYSIENHKVHFNIYNFNAFTKEEFFDEFTVPEASVVSIEDILNLANAT